MTASYSMEWCYPSLGYSFGEHITNLSNAAMNIFVFFVSFPSLWDYFLKMTFPHKCSIWVQGNDPHLDPALMITTSAGDYRIHCNIVTPMLPF